MELLYHIKKQRKQKNITQEQLAERLSVSVGYVSQIERGITKANLEMLSNICAELSCDITYLFTGALVEQSSYLESELNDRYKRMTQRQKQMRLGIMDLILAAED